MSAVPQAARRLGRLERPALTGVLVREIVNCSSYWRSSTFSSTVEPTIYLLAFGFGFGSLVSEHAGQQVLEVYGPPARLAEVERTAGAEGLRTRRTGTSVSILGVGGGNGLGVDGERRPANLEDVFVLLTGEEIA